MKKIEISNNEYPVASPTLAVWLISTISKNGINNIAPYGMIMPVSYQPLILAVGTDTDRDTYRNIIETGEFVLNMASTQMIKNVNITAKRVPPEIDEFETANLTPIPSLKIKPNRIKECKIHIECQLIDNLEITESRRIITANSLVITINSDVYLKNHAQQKGLLDPIFYVKGSYFALGRFVGKR